MSFIDSWNLLLNGFKIGVIMCIGCHKCLVYFCYNFGVCSNTGCFDLQDVSVVVIQPRPDDSTRKRVRNSLILSCVIHIFSVRKVL